MSQDPCNCAIFQDIPSESNELTIYRCPVARPPFYFWEGLRRKLKYNHVIGRKHANEIG